ncbi:transposase [Siculibacillus lacustris]|uniref:Transposase n=1 Tax=Siculibacillus lacustris TaxID=1549641 RepID=A0A4Q9VCB5_9HYPH|nr:transposase [Siculibacillus lacustris]TBW32115.1 transposase [Siculibacillus lacustris]
MAEIAKKTQRFRTDLTDEEWSLIVSLQPRPASTVRPSVVDLRKVLNAIRYLGRTGCGWRMLPHDFSMWRTVYWWFSSESLSNSNEGPTVAERAPQHRGVSQRNRRLSDLTDHRAAVHRSSLVDPAVRPRQGFDGAGRRAGVTLPPVTSSHLSGRSHRHQRPPSETPRFALSQRPSSTSGNTSCRDAQETPAGADAVTTKPVWAFIALTIFFPDRCLA